MLHPRRLQLGLTSKDRVGSSNTKTWTPFKTTKTNQHHQGKSQLNTIKTWNKRRNKENKTKHLKSFKSTKLHVKWMKLWSKRRAWYFLRKQNLDPFDGAEQNWWTNKAVVWVAYKKNTKSAMSWVCRYIHDHNYIYASDLWRSAKNVQKFDQVKKKGLVLSSGPGSRRVTGTANELIRRIEIIAVGMVGNPLINSHNELQQFGHAYFGVSRMWNCLSCLVPKNQQDALFVLFTSLHLVTRWGDVTIPVAWPGFI